MDAEHPRRIGDYEILGPLGKGSMGQVFKAVQPSLNRVVALKVLPGEFAKDDDRVERFDREAQAVAMLNHPNVVQIIDKDRDGETLYFVMEYVPGASLDRVLRKRRLSLHEAIRVIKGVCRGLEAAHRQNIVHRDLNPRNILVSDDLSVVKLADFGISRVEAISREMGTLSTSEVAMGTLHYMAPEQARDMTATDHRSDIYSAGVLLYEMLTGRVPIGRFSLPSQLNSEVPSTIDPIVLKCLETEPSRRYATVPHLLTDIRRLEDELRLGLVSELKGLSASTSKIFRVGTTTINKHGRWVAAAIGGLVLVAVVGGGAIFLARRPTAGTEKAPSAAVDTTEAHADPVLVTQVDRFAGETETSDPDLEAAIAALDPPEDDSAEDDSAEDADAPSPHATPLAGTAQAAPVTLPAETAEASPSTEAEEELRVAADKLAAKLYDPALADLEAFVDKYGGTPLEPEAYLLMAQARDGKGEVDQALASYVELESRFPDDERAEEARYRRAELLARAKGDEGRGEARRLFDSLAAQHSASQWAPRALAAKARIEDQMTLSQKDAVLGRTVPAALSTYRELIERYPDSSAATDSLWRAGTLYDEAKLFARAAASYSEYARRRPDNTRDAWWEAARLYDRKLDDKEKALAAYGNVPQRSSHYNDAQKRAKRLSN